MKLEAVLVCVNYADFLSITLPVNKNQFDNVIILTDFNDKETHQLCKEHGVCGFATDAFYKNGTIFNKGAALDLALHNLKFNDWVCILDADIILPKTFRQNIQWNHLDKNKMYGGSRRFVWTYQQYLDLKEGKIKEENFESIEGYGCGFAQIFHRQANIFQKYDTLHPHSETAGQTDINFLKRFHPDVRTVGKLDFIALHLGPHGNFHEGRLNSRIPELSGKSFFDMPDVSNNPIYK